MADIFSTQPPAWLQDIARPIDVKLTGQVFGSLIAGGLIAKDMVKAESADIKEKTGEEPGFGEKTGMWLKDFLPAAHEARMNLTDPLWKIKAQKAQLGILGDALGIIGAQQTINANKTKMALTAQDTENIPKWLQDHPTIESRMDAEWPSAKTPEWNRNLDQLRLRDSQSVQAKVITSGVKAFTDRLTALSKDDPTAAAQISGAAQQYTAKGQVPPPAVTKALALAEESAAAKKQNDLAAQQLKIDEAIAKTEAEGGTVQRTFGPKGESVTVKPAGASGKEVSPKMIELGGHQIIYNPKAGGFKVMTPQGQEKAMTPAQLLSISELLAQSGDSTSTNNAAKIKKFLGDTAMKQIDGTPAPAATEGRVRVVGPNGETGTVPKGSPLPKGWQLQP